jgi:hypothetical protein
VPIRSGWLFSGLIFVLAFVADTKAQTAADILSQTTVNSLAAAGGAVTTAPLWAQGLGDLNDAGNFTNQVIKGNYLGAAQSAVNWTTVTLEGRLGGPIAAGLTQGALDLGDLVIAPRIAGALVTAFPGVFIPTSPVVRSTNFGGQALPVTPKANTAPTGPRNNLGNPPKLGPSYVAIPQLKASTNSQAPNANQSNTMATSNAWLVALMTNPNNDLAMRKIAAIALGVNPDIITSNPTATKLLAAVYGVTALEGGKAIPQSAG